LAVSALRNLFFDPGNLYRMIFGQALNGRDLASDHVFYINNTGSLCFAVNENRAHAAFGNAAGVFYTRNPQVVSQNPQQRGIRVLIDLPLYPVHV
jgi:hypothetical protein